MTQLEKIEINSSTGEVLTGKFTTNVDEPPKELSGEYNDALCCVRNLQERCKERGFRLFWTTIRELAKEKNKTVSDVNKKDVEPIQAQLRFVREIQDAIAKPILEYNMGITKWRSEPMLYVIPDRTPRFEFDWETGCVIER